MRYSLWSRFQGGLLGSRIGERLAEQYAQRQLSEELSRLLFPWGEIQRCAITSLIDCGGLDLADWGERLRVREASLLQLKQMGSVSETAIAVLPIALYFHDRRGLLQEQVSQAAALWLAPQESLEDVLMWAEVIAGSLREKLTPDGFFEHLRETVAAPSSTTLSQLNQLRNLCDRAYPLEGVLDCSLSPLALAFYCFASTPEDFSLCVQRAAQTRHTPQTVAALTGAIAGLYNSLCGIPLHWRTHSSWAQTSQQQAEQLFATWSGVYQPHRPLTGVRAIAAAGSLQPRSSLKIISHHLC